MWKKRKEENQKRTPVFFGARKIRVAICSLGPESVLFEPLRCAHRPLASLIALSMSSPTSLNSSLSRGGSTQHLKVAKARTSLLGSESPITAVRDQEGYIAVPQSLLSSAYITDIRAQPSNVGFQPPKDGEFESTFFQGLDIERSLTDQENALLPVCVTLSSKEIAHCLAMAS